MLLGRRSFRATKAIAWIAIGVILPIVVQFQLWNFVHDDGSITPVLPRAFKRWCNVPGSEVSARFESSSFSPEAPRLFAKNTPMSWAPQKFKHQGGCLELHSWSARSRRACSARVVRGRSPVCPRRGRSCNPQQPSSRRRRVHLRGIQGRRHPR